MVPGDAGDATVFDVAGVAFGDIDVTFVWQVWHVAGVAPTALGRFGGAPWSAWHLVTFATFVWHAWRLVIVTVLLCGRRGTW